MQHNLIDVRTYTTSGLDKPPFVTPSNFHSMFVHDILAIGYVNIFGKSLEPFRSFDDYKDTYIFEPFPFSTRAATAVT